MIDEIMSPQPISHYEVLEKLGEGGMGVVWKARDTRLNRLVAIKTLPAAKVGDEERKRRFVQEAQAASALNHPNIITIHDIASENGVDFIVMEYVNGKTLGQLIPRRGMRLDEVLRYAIQIAGALAKAHAAGIIHRDLKPGNIMVTTDGNVKLLDFGLAKLTEPATPYQDGRTRTLGPQSEEGSIVGTAAYMSPEQAESKPVDARSDIFSFGAVLYEMVTGVRAFQGDSRLSTLSAVLREAPKPAGELVPDIPRELDRIVTRCLRKDPARRLQAMSDLKVALEDLKEERDSGTVEMAAGKPAADRAKSRRGLLLASAAGLLVAVAGAGWFLLRPTSKPLPAMRSVPLTTYPGSELHPTFSPDGSQVAFAWNGEKQDNWDIYVKLVDGGAPSRLTTNPERDTSPSWSPDGRQIAFIREGSGIYSISPLGGTERKLTDAHADELAWTPDGESLLISSAKSHQKLHSIFRFSLRNGEMQKLTSPPPLVGPGDGDHLPSIAPDGQTIAFLRSANLVGDIFLQPFAGGTPRRLTTGSLTYSYNGTITWPSNREIVFSRGIWGNTALWRVATDGRSEPQPVLGALDGGSYPAIAHPAKGPARLAYQRLVIDSNIWRMAVDSEPDGKFRIVTEPAAIVASTRNDTEPQFSPDGKRLAFGSDREGYREIWVGGSDGSNPVRLTTFNSERCGSPKWSPDGSRIVFDSLVSGNNDIWIVGSEGGSPKQITTEPSNEARPFWSRDGTWIYFRSDRSGAQQIWKIPASEPYKPAVQVTRNGGFEALESPDGKRLFYVKLHQGLWSMPAEGGDETPVLQNLQPAFWAVSEKGIYFFDFTRSSPDAGTPLEFFEFATRIVTHVRTIPKVVQLTFQLTMTTSPSMSVTRDGRWIAWVQVDHQDSDLMLIENFR
jgi:serine/threonine protein kinase